jgi:Domain of unknown function (DUF4180)
MSDRLCEMHGMRIWECSADGTVLQTSREAIDVIGEARGHGASLAVIPASRLAPEFFQLRTGFAGEVLQKFVSYGVRLAIVGDVSIFSSKSSALRDLIRESNRGRDIWFLDDIEDLSSRLEVEKAGQA